jgi:hypothetical protein
MIWLLPHPFPSPISKLSLFGNSHNLPSQNAVGAKEDQDQVACISIPNVGLLMYCKHELIVLACKHETWSNPEIE